jgi:heterotetrameric sarcosine oxidase gamma subunit
MIPQTGDWSTPMPDRITTRALPQATLVKLHSLDDHPLQGRIPLPGWTEDALPAPGQASGDRPAVLCLRPREWLWVDQSASDDPSLEDALRQSVQADRCTVIDLSDGLDTLRVSGPGSAWLLAKLSGLDFCSMSGNRHATRTRMGDAAVLVHHHEAGAEGWVFDLLVDRSLAKYLDGLLNASLAHAGELAAQHGDFR